MDIDIDRVCRCCLSENSDTYYQTNESAKCYNDSLFDWRNLDLTIADVIMACTAVQIRNDDAMPKAVCIECLHQVQLAFGFKKLCEATDEKLRTYAANVKIENEECEDSIREPETVHVSEISLKELNDNDSDDEIKNEPFVPDFDDECDKDSNSYCESFETTEKTDEIDSTKNVDTFLLKNVDEKALMEQTHIINGRYQCVFCTKSLGARKSYRLHLRLHTGKNLKRCNVCERGFAKKSHLDRHLLTHKKIVKCNFCTRIFATEMEQNDHMKICTESKALNSITTVNEPSTKNFKHKIDLVAAQKPRGIVYDSIEHDESVNSLANGQDKDESSLKKRIRIQFRESEQPTRIPLDEEELKWVNKAKQIDNGRWQCPLCPKTLTRKVIRIHIRKHVGRNLMQCHLCDKSFAANSKLKQHMLLHPKHGDFFPCDKCNEIFMTLNDQKYHFEIAHTINSTQTKIAVETYSMQLESDSNHKTFYQENHLTAHEQDHLLPKKVFECDLCQKKFNRLDNLRSHMQRHIPTEQRVDVLTKHLCSYCGVSFTNSSNLTVHIRRHTGYKPFKCESCDRRFPRGCDLICHRRTHTGEKPFVCNCGKAFSRSNQLVRHMRIHTGEKPYKCSHELCGKSFTQLNDLKLHVRRHTGEKPFVCNCGQRFITNSLLKQHRKSQGHVAQTIGETFEIGNYASILTGNDRDMAILD